MTRFSLHTRTPEFFRTRRSDQLARSAIDCELARHGPRDGDKGTAGVLCLVSCPASWNIPTNNACSGRLLALNKNRRGRTAAERTTREGLSRFPASVPRGGGDNAGGGGHVRSPCAWDAKKPGRGADIGVRNPRVVTPRVDRQYTLYCRDARVPAPLRQVHAAVS